MAGTIDHFGFQVSDVPKLLAFYEPVLATLGITKVMEIPEQAGFKGAGFAFSAPSRAAVDAFYAAALAAGASDNGSPGIRAQYHPNDYDAFVLDPGGHTIEACCHRPE